MSNTKHHGKNNHEGHDYGKRYRCNHKYNQSYGKYGRKRLHEELRSDDKTIVSRELDNHYVDFINQCDGCISSLPVKDGLHYENDKPIQVCVKGDYE